MINELVLQFSKIIDLERESTKRFVEMHKKSGDDKDNFFLKISLNSLDAELSQTEKDLADCLAKLAEYRQEIANVFPERK